MYDSGETDLKQDNTILIPLGLLTRRHDWLSIKQHRILTTRLTFNSLGTANTHDLMARNVPANPAA